MHSVDIFALCIVTLHVIKVDCVSFVIASVKVPKLIVSDGTILGKFSFQFELKADSLSSLPHQGSSSGLSHEL